MEGLMRNLVEITGDIGAMPVLKGNIGSKVDIQVEVNIPETLGRPYEGEYVVIPKAYSETVLPTTGKVLEDDVVVIKIPYYETSNVSGNTVYIASEV